MATQSEAGDLRITNVTKRFGQFIAVDDLSLTVPQGSFFALLGASGCGKTTTLRMVAGLEEPTAGEVRLGERDITRLRPYQRPVNTVFQSYALFPHLDVFENVAFGLRRRRSARDRRAGRADARAGPARAASQAPAGRAVRRPAAAGRAGPRADQPPAGAAARRAARRTRPQAAPADADRAQADPDRGRHHLRARHARPGGGHDDGRHGRGDERRADRAARPRRPRSTSTRRPRSWPTSSASPTCSPARPAASPAATSRSRPTGSGSAVPAARSRTQRGPVFLGVRPEKLALVDGGTAVPAGHQ